MWTDPLAESRRGHAALLRELALLEEAVQASRQGGGAAVLAGAIRGFAESWATTLAPFLEAEEKFVYPLLDRYLPEEVRSPELLRQELATLRDLVPMLTGLGERLQQGEPAALEEARVVVADLALLAREHIRKEDELVYPLLLRLLEESPDA